MRKTLPSGGKSSRSVLLIAALLAMLIGLPNVHGGLVGLEANSSTPSSAVGTPGDCGGPVRVAYLQDKSRSTQAFGVYQLQVEELEPILSLITRCGGELAVGFVGERSGAPLHRVFVPTPTPRPAEPSGRETAIKAAITRATYNERLKTVESLEQQRVQDAELRFRAFRENVRTLLSTSALERVTPLWTALARADAFLGEPDPPAIKTRRYLVLSSDGVNNAGHPAALKSGATLFICNGPDAVGSLQALPSIVVESPIAAFRRILEAEQSHGR